MTLVLCAARLLNYSQFPFRIQSNDNKTNQLEHILTRISLTNIHTNGFTDDDNDDDDNDDVHGNNSSHFEWFV